MNLHAARNMFSNSRNSVKHNVRSTLESKGQVCGGLSRPLVVSDLFNNIIRQSNLGSLIPLHEASEFVHFVSGGVVALSAIQLVNSDSGFVKLDKFPGLLEKFSCMALVWDCKAPAGVRPGCRFDHDAVEMKHCCVLVNKMDKNLWQIQHLYG